MEISETRYFVIDLPKKHNVSREPSMSLADVIEALGEVSPILSTI